MGADPDPPRRFRWARRLGVSAILLVALVVAANLYLLAASRSSIVSDLAEAPPRPYALVLGSPVTPEGTPTRSLAERLETGWQLYRAGLARRIIVSGAVSPGYDEPDVMAAWLTSRGVAPADVVIDRGGYRTAASMADAAALGALELLIVSQRSHLPRALYLAKHAGLQAIGVTAREPYRSPRGRLVVFIRETTARAEAMVEVALRGVRGLPTDQIPPAPAGPAG
jgi:vancomycin permeability regulator SanA